MVNNSEECPKCLGITETMEANETIGFKYKKCTLCKGTGKVPSELADDYIFSLNEDNFEEDELTY